MEAKRDVGGPPRWPGATRHLGGVKLDSAYPSHGNAENGLSEKTLSLNPLQLLYLVLVTAILTVVSFGARVS